MCPFINRLSFLEGFRKISEKLKFSRADFLLWSEKSFKTSTEAFWSPQVTRHERVLFGYVFTIIKESFCTNSYFNNSIASTKFVINSRVFEKMIIRTFLNIWYPCTAIEVCFQISRSKSSRTEYSIVL